MFTLLGLIIKPDAEITVESLASKFENEFISDKNFKFRVERHPLLREKYIHLSWDKWQVSIFLEKGRKINENLKYIANLAPADLANKVVNVKMYIRMVFGSDEEKEYTNESIKIWEIVENIGETIIFNPQKDRIES